MTFKYMKQHLENVKQYGVTIDDIINDLERDIDRFNIEIARGNNVEAFTKEREMFIASLHDWCNYKSKMGL